MTTNPPTPQTDAATTQPSPLSADASPATPPATVNRAWLLPALTGVLGLLVGAGGMGAISANRAAAVEREERATAEASADASAKAAADAAATRAAILKDAVAACGLQGETGLDLGDDGGSLVFDMKGTDDYDGASIDNIACLFARLEMPSAVSAHIDQTTSMDGRQTETWDNLTVSWSYHPDRGLDGVLTVNAD